VFVFDDVAATGMSLITARSMMTWAFPHELNAAEFHYGTLVDVPAARPTGRISLSAAGVMMEAHGNGLEDERRLQRIVERWHNRSEVLGVRREPLTANCTTIDTPESKETRLVICAAFGSSDMVL